MRRVKRRRIRRFLEVLPMIDQAQKELKRPLILTVGPWGAERHVRNTVAERQAGAQRRARAFSGRNAPGVPSSSVKICPRFDKANPSSGMVGELRSQPPLGVIETRLP